MDEVQVTARHVTGAVLVVTVRATPGGGARVTYSLRDAGGLARGWRRWLAAWQGWMEQGRQSGVPGPLPKGWRWEA